MRLTYDPTTDSLCIHLGEKPGVDSDEVADGVVLDVDEAGGLVGIDVQHASLHADISRLIVNLPCNEHRAVVSITSLNVMDGHLPARVRGLVAEWAELHQQELHAMWESKEFHRIEPLV